MQTPKPFPYNVLPDDTTGKTWALPDGAIIRLGKGYQDSQRVNIALSPDSTYFAVGTRLGLWWYDVTSMSPIALWETERGMISVIDISPDGKLIAYANWDGFIKVRDIQSGECITQIKLTEEHFVCRNLTFSPDGCCIAIVNEDGNVEVLDVQSGECITQIEQQLNEDQKYYVSILEFSPDGQHLATRLGKQIYVWNRLTGSLTAKFTGWNFVFSPDSHLLTCVNTNRIPNTTPVQGVSDISVWDIATGEHVAHFTEHKEVVTTVRFSPNGQLIASSDRKSILHVWNPTEGLLKETYTDYEKSAIRSEYLSDGTLLVTVFNRETVEMWNVEQQEKLWTHERKNESIGDKWFSRYPNLLIAHALSDNLNSTNKTQSFPTLEESDGYLYPGLFSPNGETLASRGHNNGIVLWDVERKQEQELIFKEKSVGAFAFLPDGNILVIKRDQDDYTVSEISKTDEVVIGKFTLPSLERHTAAFSGCRFAIGGKGGNLYLCDPKHSEKPRSFIGHTEHIWSLAFSPDGKRLVSGSSDKTARIWEVETSKEIATLPLDTPRTTNALTISPCGNVIAGGMLGEIRFWCAENFNLIHSIPQPEDSPSPYALAFPPCGSFLASGTWRKRGMQKMAIRLWDVATGKNIHTFWGHPTDVQTLDFSPDGTLLASGSFDGTILLWDVNPFIRSQD